MGVLRVLGVLGRVLWFWGFRSFRGLGVWGCGFGVCSELGLDLFQGSFWLGKGSLVVPSMRVLYTFAALISLAAL